MLYNQTDTWRTNRTNFSFFETSSMYSPGWYVSDGHLFASLLIKSDNYELLEQTPHWLFWPHERFPEHYYSPLERKSKSTLLQSTRRLKQLLHPSSLQRRWQVCNLHSWRYYKRTRNKDLAAEPTSVRQSCARSLAALPSKIYFACSIPPAMQTIKSVLPSPLYVFCKNFSHTTLLCFVKHN